MSEHSGINAQNTLKANETITISQFLNCGETTKHFTFYLGFVLVSSDCVKGPLSRILFGKHHYTLQPTVFVVVSDQIGMVFSFFQHCK